MPTRMQRIIIAAMILIPVAAVAAYYYLFGTDTTGTSVAGTRGVVYLIEMALMLFVAIVSGIVKFHSRRKRYSTQPVRRRVEKPRYWKKGQAEEARTQNAETIIAIALLTAIIAMSYLLGAVTKAETMMQELHIDSLGFLVIAWAGFATMVVAIAVILDMLRGLLFRSQ